MASNINFSKAYRKFLRLLTTNTASCIAIATLFSGAFAVGKTYENNASIKMINSINSERQKEDREIDKELFELRREIFELVESEKDLKKKLEECSQNLEWHEKQKK